MSKLRENAFAVGVTALLIGWAVLLYFFVISPLIFDIPGVEADLTRVNRDLGRLADEKKTPIFPTQDHLDYLTERRKGLKIAIDLAKDYYSEKKQRFDELFADFPTLPPPGQFTATFHSEIEKLQEKYTEQYRPEPPPPEPGAEEEELLTRDEEETLTVKRMEVYEEADVLKAMKHFWIIEQLFTSLHKLDIGGLSAIKFPIEDKSDLPTPDEYDVIRAEITLEISPGKLTPFLVDIFESDRVPFLDIETLEVISIPEKRVIQNIKEENYNIKSEAEAGRAELIGEEPPVSVMIRFAVMDWKGLPEKEGKGKSRRGRRTSK